MYNYPGKTTTIFPSRTYQSKSILGVIADLCEGNTPFGRPPAFGGFPGQNAPPGAAIPPGMGKYR